MLNEEKIKLMAKMAMFAKTSEGRQAIEASKFFKHDYLARNIIWTEICVTIAYVLSIFLFAVFKMDTLVTDIATINFGTLGVVLIVVYVAVLVLFFLFAYSFYEKKYNKMRKLAAGYCADLKKLDNYYKSQTELSSDEDDIYTVG